jgi:hypothetical protein
MFCFSLKRRPASFLSSFPLFCQVFPEISLAVLWDFKGYSVEIAFLREFLGLAPLRIFA